MRMLATFLMAAAAALPLLPAAHADGFPDKPITLVVGFPVT